MKIHGLENRKIQLKTLPVCCALICITAGLLFWGEAVADPGLKSARLKSAVVVSKKIRPYLQVVDGITKEAGAEPNTVDVFFLMSDDSANRELLNSIEESGFDVVLAVGPEAATLVFGSNLPAEKLYTAILDPGTIPGIGEGACGISLRIPVAEQLNRIALALPTLKKLGLLFDPDHNQWFFEAAVKASQAAGVEIVPMRVTRRNEIARAWSTQDMDAVWMIPDQTVISEKIVQFVIKEGIYRNVGVIGYNAFFIRSGAVFSFEFDYQDLGRQAGRKLLTLGSGTVCLPEPPVFNTIVNRKIAEKIGMEVAP